MNKNDSYLYYDTTAQDWLPATLEDLLHKNDPTLNICRLNPDGTPGDTITYQDLPTPAPIQPSAPTQPSAPQPTAPLTTQPQDQTQEALLKHLSAIRFGIALLIAYMAFNTSFKFDPITTFIAAYVIAAIIYVLLGIDVSFGRKKK